jgi:hypothetical protein
MAIEVFNIKDDMPTVDVALIRLEMLVQKGRKTKRIVKIIHGYGSAGAGGKIRSALRKRLISMKAEGKIKEFIPGEEFDPFSSSVQAVLSDCFELTRDCDYNRCNQGITLVIC